MPSSVVIKNKYRKAKCCGNCIHEKTNYCSLLCMKTVGTNICDSHSTDPQRDQRAVKCCQCRFGGNGDRTCEFGKAEVKGFKCCFAGVRMNGMEDKAQARLNRNTAAKADLAFRESGEAVESTVVTPDPRKGPEWRLPNTGISVDFVDVSGTAVAAMGARLPMSYDWADAVAKSDSDKDMKWSFYEGGTLITCTGRIGEKDMELMSRLIRARDRGSNAHCKAMRQINVAMSVTAPIFWWKEMDQYKVGTTTDSTSTMHRLTSRPITVDQFVSHPGFVKTMSSVTELCEKIRLRYLDQRDADPEQAKETWRKLVMLLPESYLQTRLWTANYQVLRQVYADRCSHKLSEWRSFCELLKRLPYSGLITESRDRESAED